KSKTCAGSNLCTHDTVTAVEVNVFSEEVHASPFTLRAACGLSVQFRHAAVNRYTLGDRKTMVAISSDVEVFRSGGCHTSRGNSFLPNVGMEEPPDLSFHLVLLFRREFKLPDELH